MENQLFGPVFESSFSMPLLESANLKNDINRNLNQVIFSVFDPIESIKRKKIDPLNNREIPYFNKYYKDLSCVGINVFENPIEALLISLSKISWNKKLKRNNMSKIDNICTVISGEKCPQFFSKKKLNKIKQKEYFESLKSVSQMYEFILQNLN
jgi:hypothetical protein